MAAASKPPISRSASVDYLIDENASPIDVKDGSLVQATSDTERAVGGTSPAGWWGWALVGLAIVVVILLSLQLFGGTPGTDVIPGTPVAAPETPPGGVI